MRNTLETRIGLFVALTLLAAAIILERVGSFEAFQQGRQVKALFSEIQDLKIGDRVKMAGVEVGRVQSIQLTNNKVMVVMKVRPTADIKTDSAATIKFMGLLGQNFVAVDFGTPRGEPLRLEGIGEFLFASPVGAAGRIYVTGRDGTTVVLRHDRENATLAVNHLADSFSASPALVDRELYLHGERFLYCIAEADAR